MVPNLKPTTPPNSLKITWENVCAEAHGPIGSGAVMIIVVGLVLLLAVTQSYI